MTTMNNGNRRRMMTALLLSCLLVILLIGAQMWHSLSLRPVASYGKTVVQPEVYDLCPGEALRFEQRISVTETAAIDISRDWCVKNGVCSLDLHMFWENVILTPMEFSGTVTRIVPESTLWKPGGEYEMRSGTENGKLDILIVPFKIREDCQ
jgi:hypothetical protein